MYILFLFNYYPSGHFGWFRLFLITSRIVIYQSGYNMLPPTPTDFEYLSVSVGQESGHGLAKSSASGSLTDLQLRYLSRVGSHLNA